MRRHGLDGLLPTVRWSPSHRRRPERGRSGRGHRRARLRDQRSTGCLGMLGHRIARWVLVGQRWRHRLGPGDQSGGRPTYQCRRHEQFACVLRRHGDGRACECSLHCRGLRHEQRRRRLCRVRCRQPRPNHPGARSPRHHGGPLIERGGCVRHPRLELRLQSGGHVVAVNRCLPHRKPHPTQLRIRLGLGRFGQHPLCGHLRLHRRIRELHRRQRAVDWRRGQQRNPDVDRGPCDALGDAGQFAGHWQPSRARCNRTKGWRKRWRARRWTAEP